MRVESRPYVRKYMIQRPRLIDRIELDEHVPIVEGREAREPAENLERQRSENPISERGLY